MNIGDLGLLPMVGWAPYFLFSHFPYVFWIYFMVLLFFCKTCSCLPYAGVSIAKTKNFTYNLLVGATNNFHRSNKIGRGGFGIVYKVSLNAT